MSGTGYVEIVDRWARTDRIALSSGTRRLTYREWAARGEELAAALLAVGLQRPARVATLLPNGPELLVALYACARSGLTLVPLSTWSTSTEVSRVLDAAEPEVVLTSHELAGMPGVVARAASSGVGGWRRSIFAWAVASGTGGLGGVGTIEELLAGARGPIPDQPGHGEADLAVLYTSGSTGNPKGVRLSQSAVRDNAAAIAVRMAYRDGERVFTNFPLFFSGGLCNALSGTASVGGELVTQPKFEPLAAARLIRARACTARIVWRDGLRPVVDSGSLTADDLRRLRRGLLIEPELLAELGVDDDLGVNMYGMTETATAFSCGDATDPYAVRRRSHGTPLAGNEVRVVDPDTGRTLPRASEGELWLRGPRMFSGYTDGSHEAVMSEDGFFRTGDIGRLDAAGHLHYLGRTKTLIKVKGLTVQPEEVEARIGAFHGVRHVVVSGLGEGDESKGVGALVVVDGTSGTDAQEVVNYCRTHLSAYKVPVVRVVPESDFPLSASLKPDRLAARRLLAGLVDH